ncbi:MAG: TatD family hydrolase [Deltaproteobacteria bacterium]|nr:TatD family hydrolase [Deltaproteobacteria bacterium]
MLVDAHCHLDDPQDAAAVIARATAAGVVQLVVNGLWKAPGDFGIALQLAGEHRCVSPTAAIHPHDCAQAPREDWERLEQLAADPRIVAVGETGLDFHYNHSPPDRQREAFRWTISLARKVHKPLVVHVREADAEAAAILKEEGASVVGGQIHCFSADAAAARAYLDLGFHISFSGIVTFKSAEPQREAARITPGDRLLVETDSPYLAPLPYRGKRNEPAFIVETARRLALVRGTELAEVARVTTENAKRLFSLAFSDSAGA